MKFAYHSDIGKRRTTNQDRCCVIQNTVGQTLGIVCDGMGGHLAGEQAAQMAMDMICQSFLESSPFISEAKASSWLIESIEKANEEIFNDACSHKEHQGMGTTLVAAIYLNDEIIIAHVGDSRAYFFDGEKMLQLTKDHTYVNLLIESGSINKEQAKYHPQKNVLLKAVGVFESLVVSSQKISKQPGLLCLCSDGLYNCLDEDEMVHILNENMPLEEKVMTMISKANDNGGLDNISVVLIEEGGISHE